LASVTSVDFSTTGTSTATTADWSVPARLAFRFLFVYIVLYSLLTQLLTSLIPIPNLDVKDLSTHWPVRPVVLWTAVHILRVPQPSYADTGSGDKMFDWALVFCFLVFAAIATVVWSALDRNRSNYPTLYKWLRFSVRILLVGQMFSYGLAKVIPMQMPFPNLATLLEPYGNFSPMGVLWTSIGSAPAYEIFAGSAEVLAGILILIPRTSTLGALVCMADMTNVFLLNMTYDVPVKLLSFQLFLLAFFLVSPELPRLVNFFFLNRTAPPSAEPPLFPTPRANRIALAAQLLFGLTLFLVNADTSYGFAKQIGFARPKSSLYGIWDVQQQFIDGELRSPLLGDSGRWRRVVFDRPTRVAFQRLDDSLVRYGAHISEGDKTLAITSDTDKNWKANFKFDRPAPDQLVLEGDMDGHKTRLQLKLLDLKQFDLIGRGFHWVSEVPYNR
jgi:uncharacterized membrane protein YphA (DoxX/SURF4 family)